MPQNIYSNPGEMRPKFPDMPGGALAGVMAARDRGMFEQNMALQQALTELERQKAQEEMTEGYPVRTAQRGQQMTEADLAALIARQKAATPGYADAMTRGAMGTANAEQARGRVALETADSGIAATNSKNNLEAATNFLKNLEQQTPLFEDPTPTAPGMTRGMDNYARFLQGLPEGARRMLPQQYDPQRMKAIRESLINSVTEMQKKQDDDRRKAMELEKQTLANKGALDVANARNAARSRTLMMEWRAAKTPEQQIFIGEQLLIDPEVTDPVKDIVRRGVEAARRIFAEKQARGQFDLGNIRGGQGPVADAINSRLQQQGGQPGQPQSPQQMFANPKHNPSGWKYEPEKYDYRINPVTGIIERKAKMTPASAAPRG